MKDHNVTGLIIAAGLSKRMGSFKPLDDFEGEPFIVSVTRKISSVCGKVIIVAGYKSDEINSVIKSRFAGKNISLVFNPDYEKGMFTSLQKGIAAAGDADWILYHFVDQPFFNEKFYSDFLSQLSEKADWIQPAYKGKEGHPILFNKKVARLIMQSSPDSSLRNIKGDSQIIKAGWDCIYPEILTDFDSKQDISYYYNSKK